MLSAPTRETLIKELGLEEAADDATDRVDHVDRARVVRCRVARAEFGHRPREPLDVGRLERSPERLGACLQHREHVAGDHGARRLLTQYADEIVNVPVADAQSWQDIDTVEDLAAARRAATHRRD